ncbi:MAG TPA: sugar isomerase [Candidatus Hydrogenedentes bacterium]|nr:sugar isomerase [Candidatus Hydrogenedentota bacterium]
MSSSPSLNARDLRVGFLAIGRKRPGFDADWGQTIEQAAWKAVQAIAGEAVRPATRTVDDGTLRAALGELKQAGCDTVVVLQPTMGDGRLAPVLAQVWDAPLVLWATPERPDGDKVSSCSLVGAHAFASLLRQLGRPFELAYGHPDATDTRRQLVEALRLTHAARSLRQAKAGLVGTHAPGFINMQVDPSALSRDLGVQLYHVGLHEFVDLVQAQEESAVQRDVDAVKTLSLPLDATLSEDDLAANSRYYLAMRALMDEEHLDALAVRCWPELPNVIGHWPYLAMMRLAEEGRVVALEGDVDGALTCLAGKLLGLGPGYISDWLEHNAETITFWHPGHAVRTFCEPESIELGRHFNNGKPLVVNAVLRANMPVTICRLWRCDGGYRLTACEGRTRPVERDLLGAHGVTALEGRSPVAWFDALCHEGMPHHVVLFEGHHAGLLGRSARQLGIPVVV